MIFKLTFDDGRVDWCTAKDHLDLFQSYDRDYDFSLQEIESLEVITEEEARATLIRNYDHEVGGDEPVEVSVWDIAVSDSFEIIASTEFI